MPNTLDTAHAREIIKAEMAARKMTAAQVAQEANIAKGTLDNFLDGTTASPAFDRLCAIGAVLGLSPNQLSGVPDPAPAAVPPPSDDVFRLVEALKESHQREIDHFTKYHEELRRDRLFWRIVSIVLLLVLFLTVLYFSWEILNPSKGITDILWGEYFS